jgi:hypothetical protein
MTNAVLLKQSKDNLDFHNKWYWNDISSVKTHEETTR